MQTVSESSTLPPSKTEFHEYLCPWCNGERVEQHTIGQAFPEETHRAFKSDYIQAVNNFLSHKPPLKLPAIGGFQTLNRWIYEFQDTRAALILKHYGRPEEKMYWPATCHICEGKRVIYLPYLLDHPSRQA